MKVVDAGHRYVLQTIDGNEHTKDQLLQFVKREGEGYPGNFGHYEGTIIQDVLRALIDRIKYCDNQIPSEYNRRVLYDLRHALLQLEIRAALRHSTSLGIVEVDTIEELPVGKNGHLLIGAGSE